MITFDLLLQIFIVYICFTLIINWCLIKLFGFIDEQAAPLLFWIYFLLSPFTLSYSIGVVLEEIYREKYEFNKLHNAVVESLKEEGIKVDDTEIFAKIFATHLEFATLSSMREVLDSMTEAGFYEKVGANEYHFIGSKENYEG